MSEREAYNQGGRCGHGEGWKRSLTDYVPGEEHDLATEAYVNGNVEYNEPSERAAWERGYREQYVNAVQRIKLPARCQYLVERLPGSWEGSGE